MKKTDLFKWILPSIIGLSLASCSWGRYPCPPGVSVQNTEKDGSGIDLVEVKKDHRGLIRKKNPKRIKKK